MKDKGKRGSSADLEKVERGNEEVQVKDEKESRCNRLTKGKFVDGSRSVQGNKAG